MLLTIIAFIAVLSVLVFVHELGHFLTAKKFNAEVEEFGFGLPPRLGGIMKVNGKWRWISGNKEPEKPDDGKDHVLYSINWLPIGGFVKIRGENGVEDNAQAHPRSFAVKPIWQRAIILSAGIVMNILLCAVLLSIGFMSGLPAVISGEDSGRGTIISDSSLQVLEVISNSPAQEAGFRMGDVIVSVDGTKFDSFQDLSPYLLERENQSVSFVISRGAEEIIKDVSVVAYQSQGQEVVGVGVSLVSTALVRYPWYFAIWRGIETTFFWLIAIIMAFAMIIKNLVMGAPIGIEVAGPVGIAALTGQAAHMGLIYVLQFTALFSINLAIINAFPIPALDGGRLLFLVIEKIRGKAVKQKWENLSHGIGFMLLMLLIVFITYRDLVRYSGDIINFFRGLIGW